MLDTSTSPAAHWQTLPLTSIRVTGGIWAQRAHTNHAISLRHGYTMLEASGNFHDLRLAAGSLEGEYQGPRYIDSDLYKWLEALAYALATQPDPELEAMAQQVIGWIGAAQREDGYINTYYQVVAPDQRWQDIKDGHELYCAGHLIEAAVAHYQLLGARELLDIALRFAACIERVFSAGGRQIPPGHPELELALVKLYRVTRDQRWLNLARFFIDARGLGRLGAGARSDYYQDRVPVRQQHKLEGHAVRALYLLSGVTDLLLENALEADYLAATLAQWDDLVQRKLYITGGAGARYEGEAFGEPYELPSDRAYSETCAAIASIFWNWRLLHLTADVRHADLIERTLYNALLAGVSLDGTGYFYVNPLASRSGGARPQWHGCACCPPNVMRLLASLGHYAASSSNDGLIIHHYLPLTLDHAGWRVRIATDYPFDETIHIHIDDAPEGDQTLYVRVPGWCSGARVRVNDADEQAAPTGYVALRRQWRTGDQIVLTLPMPPRLTEANPRIDALRGSVAIEHGPVVYCLEAVDQPDVPLDDLLLDPQAAHPRVASASFAGAPLIELDGLVRAAWHDPLIYRPYAPQPEAFTPITLRAIPYHLWANRGSGAMRVWLPITITR